MTLTVTEIALIDLQRQQEAIELRRRQLSPGYEPGDLRIPPESIDALCLPVRIEVDFDDPVRTRQQLEILIGGCSDAVALSQEHRMGINRQRLLMRERMKSTADMVAVQRGKTPAGRRRATILRLADQSK